MKELEFGTPPPSCPSNLTAFDFPSTTILTGIIALVSAVVAVVTAWRYNSVKVFETKIRTHNISNTWWVVYYALAATRATISACWYGLNSQIKETEWLYDTLFIIPVIMHGLATLFMSLALFHQIRYRTFPLSIQQRQQPAHAANEKDPLIKKYTTLKDTMSGPIPVFVALFLIYIAFFILELTHDTAVSGSTHGLFYILFGTAFAVQRIPIAVMVIIIVFTQKTVQESPFRESKIYLMIGAVLNTINDLPLFMWATLLPHHSCVFVVASWVDFVEFFYLLSLVILFLFVRAEYLRNMEECIWTTVSQIQDTFNFRRF